MMGKVDLLVPDDWKVEVEAMPVMGTVRDRRFRSQIRIDDQRTPPAEATTADTPAVQAPTPPRVVLRGFVLMGAVVVRS